jgi:hypothetical protein
MGLYIAESNVQSRREWVSALDKIESLNPRAVIAGHKRPGNEDSPKIIEETRQYIRDFDRVAGTTTAARGLYDKIQELYPDRVNPGERSGFRRAPSNRDLTTISLTPCLQGIDCIRVTVQGCSRARPKT